MNTVNEQTSNLNSNLQNSNLTNSSSKKFARDYDKEPIIVKNYEKSYQILLKMAQLMIGLCGAVVLNSYDDYTDIIDALISCLPVFLLILIFALGEFYRYKKEQPVLKIKNGSIDFYEKGKRVFVSKRDDLRNFIYKPFFIGSERPRDWIIWIAVAPVFFYVITLSLDIAYMVFCIIVFYLVGNLLTKFFMCFILGGRNAKFSSFPVICIDEPHDTEGSFWGVPHNSYYMITIFDKDTYREVKGYFLSKHGVNIDEIDKVYF
ncbi:hypothetical protein [uncultured Campylobacter sp.]|uniref:hypothetical protein n=1 Tax=uncultured Campylobacter sp. TaxID=218934 RepID=UPI00262A994E|nr:hypothetical protein [uncultured Campylobacter sp.]